MDGPDKITSMRPGSYHQCDLAGRQGATAACLVLAILFLLSTESITSAQVEEVPTAQPPEELVLEGEVVGKRVPVRAGEICLVCNKPIGLKDVAYLVRGQRAPLHVPACYEKFLKRPQPYLAILQPHGAFLGTSGREGGLAWGWFFAGLYFLVGLVFAALCAHRALHSGQSPALWFVLGLALNVIAYLLLLTRPGKEIGAPGGMPGGLGKVAATHAPQACPRCGEMNHPSAERCANCGEKLQPVTSSEVSRAGLRPH